MCHRRNWHSLRPPGRVMGDGAIWAMILLKPSSVVVFLFLWLTAVAAPWPPSALFYSVNGGLSSAASRHTTNNDKEAAQPKTQWHNPWGDELRPFRIRQKRVHDRGMAGTIKRRHNGNADKDMGTNGMSSRNGTSAGELSADWRWPSAEKSVPLEQMPVVGPNAELTFRANQTQLLVRTETWLMGPHQCMEVHFRVEGKRTRLLLYTCHMAEGGICVLDKYLATTTHKHFLDSADRSPLDSCHKLQPWVSSSSAPFSFHFRFVRRPRKFADKAKELRHRRRRHGRHATREVGRVELGGFRTCESACGTEKGGQLYNVTLAGADYFADPLEGWKRRKR